MIEPAVDSFINIIFVKLFTPFTELVSHTHESIEIIEKFYASVNDHQSLMFSTIAKKKTPQFPYNFVLYFYFFVWVNVIDMNKMQALDNSQCLFIWFSFAHSKWSVMHFGNLILFMQFPIVSQSNPMKSSSHTLSEW